MRKKNKSIIMAMAVILAIATIASASTFAWYTAADTERNRLRNQQYGLDGVKVWEDFIPSKDFEPGVTITKNAGAVNISQSPAVIRMSFAEMLLHLHPDFMDPNSTVAYNKSATAWAFTGTALAADIQDFSYVDSFVPQLFNTGAYIDNDPTSSTYGDCIDGWKVYNATNWATDSTGTTAFFPASSFPGTTGIPAGVTILYKPSRVTNTVTLVTTVKVDFVAYAPITGDIMPGGKYQGLNQGVSLDGVFTSAMHLTDPLLIVTLADSSKILFKEAKMEPAIKYNKWALVPGFDTAPWPAAASLRVATDFTTIAATPSYLQAPTAVDPLILLNFMPEVKLTLSACVQGDWWYNAADGFFYYIDVVQPGISTKACLKSVTLSGAANNSYSDMAYDLIVYVQAIQAVKDAVDSWVVSGDLSDHFANLTPPIVLG